MSYKNISRSLFALFSIVLMLSACSFFQSDLPGFQDIENDLDNFQSFPPAEESSNGQGSLSNQANYYNEFSNDVEVEEPANNFAPSRSGEAGGSSSYSDNVESQDSVGISPMPTQPITVMPPIGKETPEPNNMYFEDYGVNPFIDTEDDFLSTFATDIDTGAYTLARSYLNQGYLPPEDSVRVEEYINYFPQGYPNPSARDTFEIFIDGGPTPFTETDSYQVIRVGIQGYDLPESDRKDAALTFVIDVSGSMGNDNRLATVQQALELLVEELSPSDSVAIIAYTDTAWVVLPHTSARHKEEIIDAIYSLYPMASTNAEAGLLLGYQEASEAYLRNGINRVVLCSDGVANVGNTGPESIWETIEDYASEGITLTSVGVGMGNYNDILMEQLADHGDGFYAYVDTLDEAERLFVHNLVSTLQVIALDAKIQVEFNPEVVSRYRLIGFENRAIADQDFRDNTVDAAEIGAGHSVTALYEIKLYPREVGEIATVHLRWQDPDTYRIEEISETIDTRDLERSFRDTSPYFQMDVLVAEFGEILRDSYWAQDTRFRDILQYAEDLPDWLERTEVYEFVDLLQTASRLAGYH
ncbi:MAG TPA: von Willebrand factor type A domain-containing protein [Anaerolineales bacterium]|nr:von Willebrand factor type A domain-containing protein [Anaerolineales bacterium]